MSSAALVTLILHLGLGRKSRIIHNSHQAVLRETLYIATEIL